MGRRRRRNSCSSVRIWSAEHNCIEEGPKQGPKELQACMEVLKDRFDPSTRHKLYLAELLGFKKCRGKDWAAFVKELKILMDSLYLSYRTTSETI